VLMHSLLAKKEKGRLHDFKQRRRIGQKSGVSVSRREKAEPARRGFYRKKKSFWGICVADPAMKKRRGGNGPMGEEGSGPRG